LIRYILKRLLQFIPSLILITFLGFLLNDYAPIDPAELLAMRTREGGNPLTAKQHETILREQRHKLGLDLPMFYFSINANYECDTLERIPNRSEREALKTLNERYRNWPAITKYYNAVKLEQYKLRPLDSDTGTIKDLKLFAAEKLSHVLTLTDDTLIINELHSVDVKKFNIYKGDTLQPDRNRFEPTHRPHAAYYDLQHSEKLSTITYPTISLNTDNRYHRWLFGDGESNLGVLRGDFGTSYTSGQKVGKIIASHIGFTLLFSLGGILLAYIISIPLGVYAAVKKNSWFDRVSSVVLFLLYSMPSFWLATLLLVCFANPDTLYWFETSGLKPAQGYPVDANIFQKLWISLPYIVLPLICFTYSSLAFLSRTLRVSVLENIKQDYITTARAKGLPQNKVIWRHAFRNSLLPMITVLANVFPYAIGGSVILETVFTLPGMGFETYRAILGQDYPVIMAMLTLTAVLTIIGLLVQDILYALADPRISYNRKK
jgi:peptide/nickel transport system permease protein